MKYECSECGWIGTEEKMKIDYYNDNKNNCKIVIYRCPKCDCSLLEGIQKMKYKCSECGWIGYRDAMDCDEWYSDDYSDSDYCLTECHKWQDLEDYEKVERN